MATCLFTNVELGPETIEEHTIPRSMGGRLLSRTVSSDEFNNACGSFCDERLQKAYAFILSRLAPLLPSASQPGLLPAVSGGMPQGLVIEPGGILARKGVSVLERDEKTGRPKAILGPDEKTLRRMAKQSGMPESAAISMVPLTKSDVLTIHLPVFAPEMELAAVKCLLLTFDHLLRDRADRFTRSESLKRTRDAIRNSVKQKQVEGDLLDQVSLGLQLEKLPLYVSLRNEMKVAQTPFEHYMFAAGNAAQRCIDVVWMILGFEPFGFRVSRKYDGPDFCVGFVNPIIKGNGASAAIELSPQDDLLCRPTKRRAFHPGGDEAAIYKNLEHVLFEVMPLRAEAFDRAVYVVNTHPGCDAWVIERFRHLRLQHQGESALGLFEQRLWDLYPHRHTNSEFKTTIKQALQMNGALTLCDGDSATLDSIDKGKAWKDWLRLYRAALEELVRSNGLPGGGFWQDVEVLNNADTWRALGVKNSAP